MRVLLVNVPHPAIGSRIPDDHLPPLGLLAIGGPLLDDGHVVRLIDGEFGPMALTDLVEEIVAWAPDAVLFGHSGSTSGHPVIAAVSRAVASRLPGLAIVYGGVYPTRSKLADWPVAPSLAGLDGVEERVHAVGFRPEIRRRVPGRIEVQVRAPAPLGAGPAEMHPRIAPVGDHVRCLEPVVIGVRTVRSAR